MNTHLIDSGFLMGLSDLRLSKAIEGMHKHPETSWFRVLSFSGTNDLSWGIVTCNDFEGLNHHTLPASMQRNVLCSSGHKADCRPRENDGGKAADV
jgi:hypothetical protein